MTIQAKRSTGFSLVEVLVSIGILALVIVGFLSLFDTSAKISKAQSARADVQESLRYVMGQLVRLARMPGAGGLPVVVPNSSPWKLAAIDIRDNVGTGGVAVPTFGTRSPIVGTDVMTFRGAFTGEILDLNTSGGAYSFDEGSNTGTVTIPATAFSGESQVGLLDGIYDRIYTDREPNGWVPVVFTQVGVESLALDPGQTRMLARYGVAILSDKSPSTRTFTFRARSSKYDSENEFLGLNIGGETAYPTGWAYTDMLRMSVINELTFYVALDDDGVPTLYQYDRASDTNFPIASDVVDLQVALGCDRNRDGVLDENTTAGGDEWLFNVSGESLTDTGPGGTVPMVGYLSDIRLTVTGRIPVADRAYVQQPVPNEDGQSSWLSQSYAGAPGANYRYVSLREQVRCRSLGPVR